MIQSKEGCLRYSSRFWAGTYDLLRPGPFFFHTVVLPLGRKRIAKCCYAATAGKSQVCGSRISQRLSTGSFRVSWGESSSATGRSGFAAPVPNQQGRDTRPSSTSTLSEFSPSKLLYASRVDAVFTSQMVMVKDICVPASQLFNTLRS